MVPDAERPDNGVFVRASYLRSDDEPAFRALSFENVTLHVPPNSK
jgi:hypothetical protein